MDLAEREQALQRRCVELDERERQMELAFGQLDELRRHSLDLLAGLDRRSQAVVQRERSAVDMRALSSFEHQAPSEPRLRILPH